MISKIESLQLEIETSEQELESLTETVESLETELQQIDTNEIETKIEQYKKLESIINKHSQKFRQQQEQVNAKQEKINHLSDHEYDPQCKYCTSNVFVQNAIEAQNTIDADRDVLNTTKEKITTSAQLINWIIFSLKSVVSLAVSLKISTAISL